jgi:hypothetical protein
MASPLKSSRDPAPHFDPARSPHPARVGSIVTGKPTRYFWGVGFDEWESVRAHEGRNKS